jgi:hypothetical protein
MAFGVGLAQLYLETGDAKRQQSPRRSAPQRPPAATAQQSWQTAWQARIDVVLAMPDGSGKSAW